MLNVFLGYGCNLSCSYCLQSPEPTKPADLGRFVLLAAQMMKKRGITEIAYWGGEPLLYWKQIKTIHEGLLSKEVPIDYVKFVTNGTRITPEHVYSLNNWGAYVAISDHSHAQPNWSNIKELHQWSYTSFFSGQQLHSYAFEEKVQRLQERLSTQVIPYMHWVRATDGCNRDYYFSEDTLRTHINHLWTLAFDALAGDQWSEILLFPHFKKWKALRNSTDTESMCNGKTNVAIDLHGNLYGCHHDVTKATRIDLRNSNDLSHRRFVDSVSCQTCPEKSWCKGNCYLSSTHELDCTLAKAKGRIFAYLEREGFLCDSSLPSMTDNKPSLITTINL